MKAWTVCLQGNCGQRLRDLKCCVKLPRECQYWFQMTFTDLFYYYYFYSCPQRQNKTNAFSSKVVQIWWGLSKIKAPLPQGAHTLTFPQGPEISNLYLLSNHYFDSLCQKHWTYLFWMAICDPWAEREFGIFSIPINTKVITKRSLLDKKSQVKGFYFAKITTTKKCLDIQCKRQGMHKKYCSPWMCCLFFSHNISQALSMLWWIT